MSNEGMCSKYLSVFNMATEINELKTLAKHVSCKCKYRFDGRKCNTDQRWTNDKRWCDCKKRYVCKKDYVCSPSTCSCESEKYLASVLDYSEIMCDETIESYNKETNFSEKKSTCKKQISYILLAFLLITIVLLIAVSI